MNIIYLVLVLIFSMVMASEPSLHELQAQNAIPTFVVERPVNAPLRITLNANIALAVENNNFKVISDHDYQIFDEDIFAKLYAYAIGFNTPKGKQIVSTWNQWSLLVPNSFLTLIKNNLVRLYPFFEKLKKDSLPEHTIVQTLDTSLIDNYCSVLSQILAHKKLTQNDESFIQSMTATLIKDRIVRTPSALNKWVTHAKLSIIQLLNQSSYGKKILATYLQDPILAPEIEAYTDQSSIDAITS